MSCCRGFRRATCRNARTRDELRRAAARRDHRSGVQQTFLARHEPSWRRPARHRQAGRVAAVSTPSQHLGARRPCRVLEVRRDEALHGRRAGIVSASEWLARRPERSRAAHKGSNWFRRPIDAAHAGDKAWRADLELLDEMHARLRVAVMRLSPRDLARTPAGRKVSNFALLSGVAAHDLYHAGQIQLLKRLGSL